MPLYSDENSMSRAKFLFKRNCKNFSVLYNFQDMKTSDIFRKALAQILSEKPRGTQGQLADYMGIRRSAFNDFIHGRAGFSEERKAEIARRLDTNYIDMLILGRKLAKEEGEQPLAPPEPEKVKPLPHAEIISKFRDPETARKINEMLVEIEARDQDIYRKIEGYIEAKHEEIKDKSVKKISNNEES